MRLNLRKAIPYTTGHLVSRRFGGHSGLLNTIFTQEGANVIPLRSAADALSSAAGKKPHIIVSDIGMPDMDGYELLKELRAVPMSDVPATAFPAYVSDEGTKPFKPAIPPWLPKSVDLDLLFDLIQGLETLPFLRPKSNFAATDPTLLPS
ncbi:MAG: response regulator [Pyrinomonadaceae bacterium]